MSKKVFIDAGHGGKDPGAFSGAFIEKELNLKVALAARDFLSDYDCEVFMTRIGDAYISVQDRYNKAVAIKADCSLCIHHNAAGGDGGEVWFWHTDADAKRLATIVAQQYKAIGQNLRTGSGMPEGTKASSTKGTNFGMCRVPAANGVPAILGEFAFVDNTTDRKIIDTDIELINEGKAYGKAAVAFLGLKLKATKPVATPTPVSNIVYRVQTGAFENLSYANGLADKLKSKGFATYMVKVDNLYKVQVGAFSVKSNADAMANKLKAAGFEAFITTKGGVAVSQETVEYKAGDIVLFGDPVNLYSNSSTSKVSKKITGTYYLYDKKEVKGRYRITTSKSKVGKKPVAFNVTGWIDKKGMINT